MKRVRRKKLTKKQLSLWKLSNTANWMEALQGLYADHPFVDWYKTTQDEEHSQHFSKRIVFCA